MESEIKKELILNAAKDIVKYLDEKYAIEPDYCDIAYYINDNLGFMFDLVEEALRKLDEYNPR